MVAVVDRPGEPGEQEAGARVGGVVLCVVGVDVTLGLRLADGSTGVLALHGRDVLHQITPDMARHGGAAGSHLRLRGQSCDNGIMVQDRLDIPELAPV